MRSSDLNTCESMDSSVSCFLPKQCLTRAEKMASCARLLLTRVLRESLISARRCREKAIIYGRTAAEKKKGQWCMGGAASVFFLSKWFGGARDETQGGNIEIC